MGTPEFAIPSMEQILASQHTIVGVVTQPDRPRGRGQKLLPPPVKQFALEHQLSPIFQPRSLKDDEFASDLKTLEADVFVVVAFRILPENIFTIPPRGTINLHPSLLPKYRGAAPIHWTIINGETTTGVTTIFIRKEVDAGNIILQKEYPVFPDDTAGTLHDRLADAGAKLLVETLDLIAAGEVATTAQDERLVSPAPKINKEMCHISFSQPARQVKQWIHGLSPFPGAFAFWENKLLKVYKAVVISEEETGDLPGTIIKAENDDLWIACQPGIVGIQELQLQGRRKLLTREFLKGTPLRKGQILQ